MSTLQETQLMHNNALETSAYPSKLVSAPTCLNVVHVFTQALPGNRWTLHTNMVSTSILKISLSLQDDGLLILLLMLPVADGETLTQFVP